MSTPIIAVTNRKGGVGKTSLAVNLAAGAAANYGKNCTLVDADPIGSTMLWMSNAPVHGLKVRKLSLPVTSGNIHHALHTWGAAISNMALDSEMVIADLPPIDIAVFSEVIRQVGTVLVPVGLSTLEWEATFPIIERVVTASADEFGPVGIIVPSRIHPQRHLPHEKITEALPSSWKLAPQISLRADFARAAEIGNWVGATSPGSLAHSEMNEVIDFVISVMK